VRNTRKCEALKKSHFGTSPRVAPYKARRSTDRVCSIVRDWYTAIARAVRVIWELTMIADVMRTTRIMNKYTCDEKKLFANSGKVRCNVMRRNGQTTFRDIIFFAIQPIHLNVCYWFLYFAWLIFVLNNRWISNILQKQFLQIGHSQSDTTSHV